MNNQPFQPVPTLFHNIAPQYLDLDDAVALLRRAAPNPAFLTELRRGYNLNNQHGLNITAAVNILTQQAQQGRLLDASRLKQAMLTHARLNGWRATTDTRNPGRALRNRDATLYARHVLLWAVDALLATNSYCNQRTPTKYMQMKNKLQSAEQQVAQTVLENTVLQAARSEAEGKRDELQEQHDALQQQTAAERLERDEKEEELNRQFEESLSDLKQQEEENEELRSRMQQADLQNQLHFQSFVGNIIQSTFAYATAMSATQQSLGLPPTYQQQLLNMGNILTGLPGNTIPALDEEQNREGEKGSGEMEGEERG